MKDIAFPTGSQLAQTSTSKHYAQTTSHLIYDHINTNHPLIINKVDQN
jgi:hypothetical protein